MAKKLHTEARQKHAEMLKVIRKAMGKRFTEAQADDVVWDMLKQEFTWITDTLR